MRVEYIVTPLGRTLYGPLEALRVWTERYEPEVLKAQAELDEQHAATEMDSR